MPIEKSETAVEFELDDSEDAKPEEGGFEDSGSEFGLQPVFTGIGGTWFTFTTFVDNEYDDMTIDEVSERPDGPWEGMACWLVDRPDDIDQISWDGLFRK